MLSAYQSDPAQQPIKDFTNCAQPDFELTRNQSMVLEQLVSLNRSAGAYELLDLLRPEGVNAAPTVYRALNQLEAKGLVRHIASTRHFTAISESNDIKEDTIMLICENCSTVTPVRNIAILKALRANAQKSNFQVHSKHIELVGICESCQR